MKKIFIYFYFLPAFAIAQSSGQNYIQTTAYKDSVANAPSIKSITYFDGLGRPTQQRAHGQSNSGKDVVTHIEYDAQGRQAKEYLPFRSNSATLDFSGSAAAEVIQFYGTGSIQETGNPNFETTNFPYSQKDFEPSPMQRVVRQSAPGEAWKLDTQGTDDHSIKFGYSSNLASDKVKKFIALAGTNLNNKGYFDVSLSLGPGGTYGAGELFKSVVKNENWVAGQNNPLANTTEEYKDKFGKVVLKRSYAESQVNNVAVFGKHDTYYVYDQYGNLSYVIPPLSDGSAGQLDTLCYQYRYDERNRLVEKKLPGKDLWEFIVYDKMGNVTATGPALSPFGTGQTGWMVNKYDALGRVAYTVWYYGQQALISENRKEMQRLTDQSAEKKERRVYIIMIDNIGINYSNDVFPKDNIHLLSINYYDSDGLIVPVTSPNFVLGQKVMYVNRGLLTGTWNRTLTSASEYAGVSTAFFYDHKGRVLRRYSQNHLGGYSILDSKYDFAGKVLYTESTHKKTDSGTDVPIVVREDFTYSAQDRLLTHTHEINSSGNIHLLASNAYDELGQLVSKEVGNLAGARPLQKVNYSYNIRGWLKGINNTQNLVQAGDIKDLFAFKLSYDQISGSTPGVKNLYNGNISEAEWRTASDNVVRKYAYGYDDMNRLKEATYQKPGGVPVPNSYGESMSYDKNGNIKSLSRYGEFDDGVVALKIDELRYDYEANSNRLLKVTDATNNPNGFKDDSDGTNDTANDYGYDDHGNMNRDDNKGIISVSYNHLNLPVEIIMASGNIKYLYDAAGVKLRKTVSETGKPVKTQDYVSGYIYSNGNLELFSNAEGYVKSTAVSGSYSFNYVYNYTDHLGNVRLSYGQDPVTLLLKVMEENNYYPYGLKHKNYNMSQKSYIKNGGGGVTLDPVCSTCTVPFKYNYKYNGKEFQDELGLNLYDYGARNYDPALGRWMNIDPLAEKHYKNNPYMYANSNPVLFIDPDGRDFSLSGKAAQDFWGKYVNARNERDGNDDWIKNRETNKMEFRVGYTSGNTPNGYDYVGPSDVRPNGDGTNTYYLENGQEVRANMPEILITATYYKPFTIGDAGVYGPYIPDAIGLSANVSANGIFGQFSLNLGFAIDNKNDFALFGGATGNLGFTPAIPGFNAGLSLDLHDNYNGNTDVLSSLGGYTRGVNASALFGGGYSRSADFSNNSFTIAPKGISTTSFNLGTGWGIGTTTSYSTILYQSN